MKRISILFSSISIVAVVGACAPATQVITRADTAPLSFQQSPSLSPVEDQAVLLNQMADELVQHSTVRGVTNGEIFACRLATLWGGASSCAVGAASGDATGGLFGRIFDQSDVDPEVEMVSADTLMRSIRDMNGQMETLQLSLPELIAQQDAELADLELRRELGALSQLDYEQRVFAISESRARIAHALTRAEDQSKQANYNMQSADAYGQDGLNWHLSATAQLAREANAARSLIAPLEMPVAAAALPEDLETPILVQAVADPFVGPAEPEVWSLPVGLVLVDLPRPGVFR